MSKELPKLVFDDCPDDDPIPRSKVRLNAKSALESHRSGVDTLEPNYKQTKRNSDGQVLQVKFSPDVTAPAMERYKTEVSSPAVKVDHQHYEQWARVPGKKVVRSSLLRGIQQLKYKMMRDERNALDLKPENKMTTSRIYSSPPKEDLHIHQLKRNILLTREKISEDRNNRLRKERTCPNIENTSSKNVLQSRNQLKPNSHLIDSGVFKQGETCASVMAETEVRLRNNDRDSAKLRHGVSRIRDRSSFPISVYQPVNIGDHVFLVNEPVRENGLTDLKKSVKKETFGPSVLLLTDKSEEYNLINKSNTFQFDMFYGGKTTSTVDSLQRSRAATGTHTLLPSRSQKRTQFMVSSAELYDFSQLSEIRHSMADKFLERSRTELLFPGRSFKMDINSAMNN